MQTGSFTPVVAIRADEGAFRAHEISPDGKFLYYETVDRSMAARIVRRSLETGEEKELYAGPAREFLSIALSPDGRRIAFLTHDLKSLENDRSLKVMPANDGEPKEILHFKQYGHRYLPLTWTADGKYILFCRQPANAADNPDAKMSLWRVPAAGGKAEKLALEMGWFDDFSVHSDGHRIAFGGPSSGRTSEEVWVMENFLPPTVASK